MNHFSEWTGTPAEAIAFQEQLRSAVKNIPFDTQIKYIGGADVSLNMFSTDLYAGIVVLSFPELQVVAHSVIKNKTTFPYIPGLLSFREVPGLIECWNNLKKDNPQFLPDVLVVDGQGITHPRRLGIAAHIGAVLDIPTIGCAKSPLYGRVSPESARTIATQLEDGTVEPGIDFEILDPKNHEVIGTMMYTKKRSKPIIVSPGHNMDVESATQIIHNCLRNYRLPEPTRRAHELVNKFRTGTL